LKRLIINADDLGADEARNAGIFEAIREGMVTSISILANGPAVEDAIRGIASLGEKKVSIGIHLNLSEGIPLVSGLRRLTGREGYFLGKARTHELLSGPRDSDLEREIQQEFDAQVRVLKNAGIPISHLDGHQHVHVFPAAVRAAVNLARRHRIPWMRVPEEPDPNPDDAAAGVYLLQEGRNFSGMGKAARLQLSEAGIRATDNFRGLYLKGRLSLSSLIDSLKALPEGLTELMVHPGRVFPTSPSNPFSQFSTLDREKELESLLEMGFRKALAEKGVELVPFPELDR
jgi:predicted glycoside hydrolase/deacetylase ChbG (UPF0249 family)